MSIQTRAFQAVFAVCPVVTIRFPDPNDKQTWQVVFGENATAQQKQNAQTAIDNLPLELNVIPFAQFIGRWSDAEYTLLLQRRATAIAAGNITLVRQWDQATANGEVDLNSSAAQSFKQQIVAAGILTQQRANVVFS